MSVTAPCSVIEPWAAIICGFVGAFVLVGASKLLIRLKIDDPLDACPLHGFCGAWGVLYTGLMAQPDYVAQAYGATTASGLFYGGGGKLFACQIIGIVTIFAWVTVLMGPFFFTLNYFGKLRVPPEVETIGLDVSKHGGSAYHDESEEQSPTAGDDQKMDDNDILKGSHHRPEI